LTLSLLRFTYDMQTGQRIKVSDRFEFPLDLDLKEYLEVLLLKFKLFFILFYEIFLRMIISLKCPTNTQSTNYLA
jgi:hypothetical protein